MKRVLTGALLLLLLPHPSYAQPTTDVTACSFDSASLSAAIALEDQAAGRPSTGTIHVTCAPDGTALVRTDKHERTVDLADVPASLAPRVIALVAVTLLNEPPPALASPETKTGTGTGTETETVPGPPSLESRPPSPPPETRLPSAATASPSPSPSPSRPSLLSSRLSLSAPRAFSARGLARVHDGTSTLFGLSLSLASGPASLGVSVAGSRIEHSFGTFPPLLFAARANVALVCSSSTCLSVDGELGRISVHASASDPMTISSRTLAATYAHAAAELSLWGRIADLDVSAIAAFGTSRGVIARVDSEAAAVLAGWTVGAAIEVRR